VAQRFQRIVVALSDPDTAAIFVTIARSMIDDDCGEVLAVTVVTDDAQAEASTDHVAEIRDALGPHPGVELQQRNAPAIARGILDFVREHNPDLVVVGMDVGADGQRFSPIADAVIDAAHCAVLAVRPGSGDTIERVVAGVDGASSALDAAGLAAVVAHGLSTPLSLIHARNASMSRVYAASVLARAETAVSDLVEPDTELVDATHPAQGINARSRSSDLLFVAAPHRRGIASIVSGGTLDQTLRHNAAHVAVLTRQPTERRRPLQRFRSWLRSLRPALTPLERESVRWRARANAPLTADYMILLGVSAILASFGLLQNSTAVVIGAMLVAPLLGPLAAASTGLVNARLDVLGRAVFTLTAGTLGSAALALVVGAVVPTDAPTEQMLLRGSPTLIDLGVAVAAGVVGAYATARKDIPAALAGVAIAAALVPPICTTGLALGLGDYDLAAGSLLLFTVNTISVVMVGAAVLWWMGLRPDDGQHRRAPWLAAITAIVLAFVMVIAGLNVFQGAQRERIAAADIRDLFPDAVVVEVVTEGDSPIVVTAIIRSTDEVVVDDVRAAETLLSDDLGRDVELRIVDQRVVSDE